MRQRCQKWRRPGREAEMWFTKARQAFGDSGKSSMGRNSSIEPSMWAESSKEGKLGGKAEVPGEGV